MKLDDLTIGEARELSRMFSTPTGPVTQLACYCGKAVVIRTVTHYYTGRVLSVDGFGIQLGNAAWIPDTGRWWNFLTSGKASEVEPYPGPVMVSLAAIVDLCEWTHELPGAQK